ncbi:hypothetical protein [Tuwongella immobilis]|uniref:Uncharacterized protein n=1 Tax=Tuwongella immobilis TaxID=692036 RepID=A0A6C2YKM9_9BACT|nr:hypothetical protein [Tuwongella immobilis]VIP01665.1 unnamed protein product [Tuwongella immobilis]VTR99083.1 unnamed protein product [Tuwongella immobilis]
MRATVLALLLVGGVVGCGDDKVSTPTALSEAQKAEQKKAQQNVQQEEMANMKANSKK